MTDLKKQASNGRKFSAPGTENRAPKKDSTNILPMVTLEDCLKLAETIHEKALETAPLSHVAKGCGYANPTSTPFYRRLQGARLFKLLGSPQPELTELAWDYFKPPTEDAKARALQTAITGIPAYADYIERNQGKRANAELLSHSLARSHNLTDDCATTCARSLVASLKFAGFFSSDGVIRSPAAPGSQPFASPAVAAHAAQEVPEAQEQAAPDSQTQTLYLDTKRKRKITVIAPLSVTAEELERVRAWLGFQLLVEPAGSAVGMSPDLSATERPVADQQTKNGDHA